MDAMTMLSTVRQEWLRDYQLADAEAIRAGWAAGHRRMLYQLVTGGGKTPVFVRLCLEDVDAGRTVLILVHRKHLVDQAVTRLLDAGMPEHLLGVYRGNDTRVRPDAPVQVASVQTLARRPGLRPIADLVVLDEAHHAPAAQTSAILGHYAEARQLGVTATPMREDGAPLANWFDALHVSAETPEKLVAAGYLSSPRILTRADNVPELDGLRRVHGDYEPGALGRRLSDSGIVGQLVERWKEHAEGRKTVCFAASVDHGRIIVNAFFVAGIHAELLSGETSDRDRVAMFARFADGVTAMIVTCDVISEGWDFPLARCAIFARPTFSRIVYLQQCGRVMRPGEVPPIILDHAGNARRFLSPLLEQPWSLYESIPMAPMPPKKRGGGEERGGKVPEYVAGELVELGEIGAWEAVAPTGPLVRVCKRCGAEVTSVYRVWRNQRATTICDKCKVSACRVCGEKATKNSSREGPNKAVCAAHQPSGSGCERPIPPCAICGQPAGGSPAKARYGAKKGRSVYCETHRNGKNRDNPEPKLCPLCDKEIGVGSRYCYAHRGASTAVKKQPCATCGELTKNPYSRARICKSYCAKHKGGPGLGRFQKGRTGAVLGTKEQRSVAAKKGAARRSPEQKVETARKMWSTRRANAAKKDPVPSQPAPATVPTKESK